MCRVDSSASDIVYDEPFENCILELDYKIPARANSGIMLRCSEDQPTAWATGIEYQIVDNINPEGDTEMAGWAYDLYKPADDPKTGKLWMPRKRTGIGITSRSSMTAATSSTG